MKNLIKPVVLRENDEVAVTSPCSGEANNNLNRYLDGLAGLASFGLRVVETSDSRLDENTLYANPQLRAADLNKAFADPAKKAVIASAGGDLESMMTLRYLDFDVLRENDKIFLGYSDNTFLHFARFTAGQASMQGPNVMEFSDMDDYTKASFVKTLFSSDVIGEIPQNTNENGGWRFISGAASGEGRLIGGCVEVILFLLSTKVWPAVEQFEDAILFLETPEQEMSPAQFQWFLRNLGAQGILNKISGLLFGKPGWGANKVDPSRLQAYDRAILKILKEYQREDLPVITNMPIGHTYPMMTVPFGCRARIDVASKRLLILEAAVRP